jgi:hypothetical protein
MGYIFIAHDPEGELIGRSHFGGNDPRFRDGFTGLLLIYGFLFSRNHRAAFSRFRETRFFHPPGGIIIALPARGGGVVFAELYRVHPYPRIWNATPFSPIRDGCDSMFSGRSGTGNDEVRNRGASIRSHSIA